MVDHLLLYARILEHMQGGVLALDAKGYVEALNPAAERMLGLAPRHAGTRPFATALFDNPANDGFAQALLDAVYEADSPHNRDVEYHLDGRTTWLNLTTSALWSDPAPGKAPRKVGVVALFIDITERKQAEAALHHLTAALEERVEQRTRQLAEANLSLKLEIAERVKAQDTLAHLAQHDALTGLANRRRFEDCLTAAIAQGEEFALLYLDLDGFKSVNDTHGHGMGDALLKSVSRRLEGCVRDGDTVARLGGDEFAIILRSTCTAEEVEAVIERITRKVAAPHSPRLDPGISVSIGVARYPEAGQTPRELLHASDRAMYAAKSSTASPSGVKASAAPPAKRG